MLLLLPLDEPPEAGIPFEVDAEAIPDLNDGILRGHGAGEAESPLPVFARTQFEFRDRADIAGRADVTASGIFLGGFSFPGLVIGRAKLSTRWREIKTDQGKNERFFGIFLKKKPIEEKTRDFIEEK